MLEILIAAAFGAPVPPESKLPYDAILYVTLLRP
jgi:hypothetical protein